MSIIGDGIVLGDGGESASIFVTGLSETNSVSATHKIPAKVENPDYVLPDGYTQLEYIESTGTQYINTGIIPSNDLVAHFTNFSAPGNTVNYSVFLGSQTEDNANDSWEFRIHPTNGKYLLDIYGQTRVQANIVQNCDIILDKSGITINGTKTAFSTTPSTMSAIYPLWLFASNTGGSAFRPSNASFSSLTLSDSTGLLRNYIPAKRVSDGEIGLYDLVNDVFYTNSGTGTFTSGLEVPQTIDEFVDGKTAVGKWEQVHNPIVRELPDGLPDGYTQLAYIESTGTQYIDTGVVPSEAGYKAEVGFCATSVPSSGESWILAAFQSSSANWRCGLINGSFYTSGGFSYSQTSSTKADTVADGANTKTSALSLHLFSQHESSGAVHTANSKYKLYYCNISNGDTALRKFIPAKRNPDSVIGLYDLVNGVFYTNSGTGTFTAGAEVPGGYTQLEYIQSSGTQYIDTGVLAKDITDSFIDFQFVSTGDTELEVMATYVDGFNRLQCGWNGTSFLTAYGATYSQTSSPTARTTAKVVPVGSPAYNVYLFAQNEKGTTVNRYSSAKIYACRISTSAGLVRDFVPTKRNSDSVIGLYDLVNDVFYTNAGTGTFTAGAEVPQTIDGFLIDKIKSYGTWTVTATDGTKTAAQDVMVDSAAQYGIKMFYWNGVLYDYGNEYTEVTGGWSNSGWVFGGKAANAGTKNATSIYLSGVSSKETIMGTTRPIDISNYSKAYFLVKPTQTHQSYPPVKGALCPTKDIYASGLVNVMASTSLVEQTLMIDLSGVDKSVPYYFCVYVGGVVSYKAYVYKIWLE